MMEQNQTPRALILAAFGTSEPGAVDSILHVRRRVAAAFPGDDVSLAFTSGTVRAAWRERAKDAAFRSAHPEIPEEIYKAPSLLSALAAAQEEGARPTVVQSLHVTAGEEFTDLHNLTALLGGYSPANPARKPFPEIAVGAPALGAADHDERSLRRAAEALSGLCEQAAHKNAALVLMAHGNGRLRQAVFRNLEHTLRDLYGNALHGRIYIGTVETAPPPPASIDAENILLAPLLLTAGEHARNDMAGDGAASWKTLFEEAGFGVECVLEGLGSNDSWEDIYVEHIREAFAELEQKTL